MNDWFFLGRRVDKKPCPYDYFGLVLVVDVEVDERDLVEIWFRFDSDLVEIWFKLKLRVFSGATMMICCSTIRL